MGGLLFGLCRRDQLTLILKVDLAARLALNLLLNPCAYAAGPMLAGLIYILLELAVFGAAGSVCARRLPWPEGQKPHPWLYSLGPTGCPLPPAGSWRNICQACSASKAWNL